MVTDADLATLDAEQLRKLAQSLLAQVGERDSVITRQTTELTWRQGKIDKLSAELALYRRWKFGRRSESLSAEQIRLFDETCAADIAEIEEELVRTAPPAPETEKRQPKRAPIPPHLPRTDIHHEPDTTACRCGCQLKRIGEDVSEKLDYTPGVISVERHIRGKWACSQCQTLN